MATVYEYDEAEWDRMVAEWQIKLRPAENRPIPKSVVLVHVGDFTITRANGKVIVREW